MYLSFVYSGVYENQSIIVMSKDVSIVPYLKRRNCLRDTVIFQQSSNISYIASVNYITHGDSEKIMTTNIPLLHQTLI